MMFVDVRHSCEIARSVEDCRSQFLDVAHHRAAGVHRRLTYEPLGALGDRQRVRTTLRLGPLRMVDVVELFEDDHGRVVQEFIEGKNEGGTLIVQFTPVGAGKTRVDAHARVPVRGVERLLAPVVGWAFGRVLQEAADEDRRDLEGGYAAPVDQTLALRSANT